MQKDFEAKLLFINLSKANDSIQRGKMEQILLAYGLPKETVTTMQKHQSNGSLTWWSTQSAGAVDYTDCISAER